MLSMKDESLEREIWSNKKENSQTFIFYFVQFLPLFLFTFPVYQKSFHFFSHTQIVSLIFFLFSHLTSSLLSPLSISISLLTIFLTPSSLHLPHSLISLKYNQKYFLNYPNNKKILCTQVEKFYLILG